MSVQSKIDQLVSEYKIYFSEVCQHLSGILLETWYEDLVKKAEFSDEYYDGVITAKIAYYYKISSLGLSVPIVMLADFNIKKSEVENYGGIYDDIFYKCTPEEYAETQRMSDRNLPFMVTPKGSKQKENIIKYYRSISEDQFKSGWLNEDIIKELDNLNQPAQV